MENITMYERMPTTVIPKQNIFSCKIDPNCITKGKKKKVFICYMFLSWRNKRNEALFKTESTR